MVCLRRVMEMLCMVCFLRVQGMPCMVYLLRMLGMLCMVCLLHVVRMLCMVCLLHVMRMLCMALVRAPAPTLVLCKLLIVRNPLGQRRGGLWVGCLPSLLRVLFMVGQSLAHMLSLCRLAGPPPVWGLV